MRVATLLATNERYLPHCRVAIASMLEHISAGNEYVVYVFHGGMPEKALALLRAMGREHVRVEPVCVRERLRDTMRELLWYTREIYFRLMAADVLPEEDKVLYMDCDVIVREDVVRLYAEDIGDALLGAYVYPGREADMNAALGTDVQAVFNSGVLLFNLRKWREIGLFERCMEVLERYPTLPCPDQDALAIVCSGRVAPLDHRWNLVTMPPNRHGLYMNGIAHMAAAVKPWTGSGDTNYALYYDVAKRLGVLPPRETPPQTWPGAWWAHRRFSGVRPAPLRAAARRAAGRPMRPAASRRRARASFSSSISRSAGSSPSSPSRRSTSPSVQLAASLAGMPRPISPSSSRHSRAERSRIAGSRSVSPYSARYRARFCSGSSGMLRRTCERKASSSTTGGRSGSGK